MSKVTIKPFKGNDHHQDFSYGEHIHSDVCGPFRVKSKGGMRYLVTYIDGVTREAYVKFMKTKDEQLSCFSEYIEHYLKPRKAYA